MHFSCVTVVGGKQLPVNVAIIRVIKVQRIIHASMHNSSYGEKPPLGGAVIPPLIVSLLVPDLEPEYFSSTVSPINCLNASTSSMAVTAKINNVIANTMQQSTCMVCIGYFEAGSLWIMDTIEICLDLHFGHSIIFLFPPRSV